MAKIYRSTVLNAPADRVWAVLRDFNGHHLWHPAVVRSRMEDDLGGDVVGGVRQFSLTGGAELREQLLRHSDRDCTLAYCIQDSSLPLLDYAATLRLKPVTDGNRTFWDWRSQFRAPQERAAELEDLVGRQFYETGLAGLRKFLAQQQAPGPQRPALEAETERPPPAARRCRPGRW